MISLFKNYHFKITLPRNKEEYLKNFKQLIEKATRQSLEKLWSEEWIIKLGTTTTKAHSIVTAGRVTIEQDGHKKYLPSRVRMGLAERIGRILRSQYNRMRCFYDCVKIMEIVGMNESVTKLTKLINQTFCDRKGIPFYKKVLLKQMIKMIQKWHQKLNMDLQMISYCQLVKPCIKKFVYSFSPDNYRELYYRVDGNEILYKIRLPTTPNSESINDWEWVEGEIPIPEKIRERINYSLNPNPKKPDMITRTLKGGKEQFFFIFPWEFQQKKNVQKIRERTLAIDLGLKKIATAVVCENNKQISKPIYLRISSRQYQRIELMYKHLKDISKQRSTKPQRFRTLKEEQARIYRKLERIKNEVAQTTTNILITKAKQWFCDSIAIEDLRSFIPKSGLNKWSRRLNEWLRGRFTQQLEYKSKEESIKLLKVPPWGTSNHCPRCANEKGEKILSPNKPTLNKRGRWFYCPKCGFNGDRDYIAALNIYRACSINYRKVKSLKDTNPIPYMEIGIPSPDCSWRGTRNDLTTTQVVLVTGG